MPRLRLLEMRVVNKSSRLFSIRVRTNDVLTRICFSAVLHWPTILFIIDTYCGILANYCDKMRQANKPGCGTLEYISEFQGVSFGRVIA